MRFPGTRRSETSPPIDVIFSIFDFVGEIITFDSYDKKRLAKGNSTNRWNVRSCNLSLFSLRCFSNGPSDQTAWPIHTHCDFNDVLSWQIFIFIAAAAVVLQVKFYVAEARGASAVAALAIVAVVIGTVALLVIDFLAIKSSTMLLFKNIRYLLTKSWFSRLLMKCRFVARRSNAKPQTLNALRYLIT